MKLEIRHVELTSQVAKGMLPAAVVKRCSYTEPLVKDNLAVVALTVPKFFKVPFIVVRELGLLIVSMPLFVKVPFTTNLVRFVDKP